MQRRYGIVLNMLIWMSILNGVALPLSVHAAQRNNEGAHSVYVPVTSATAVATTSSQNPLARLPLYVDPYSRARQQANEWRQSRPADAAQMDKIAAQPVAMWLGAWSGDIRRAVDEHVTKSVAAKRMPVFVAYNIPQRDCGSYSAGGAASADAYRQWVRALAAGINNRPAVVVVEPDALGMITCLSPTDQQTRLALLRDAVEVLSAQSQVAVYLDASLWVAVDEMATRLQQAGITRARGFSLNVSNFVDTPRNIAYGKALAARVGGKHFVIDTSRNGLGAAPDGAWCNPPGRALGARPTTATGESLADAFLWIKQPGESDGTCNGGPPAGTWWADYALGLARRAAY